MNGARSHIAFSCGYCGAACDRDGYPFAEVPLDYNPDDYDYDVCVDCGDKLRERDVYVTREMALDAGDPDLEGERW